MTETSAPDVGAEPGQAWLAPGLLMAVVDEDVIVLDSRTDAYACLPGAAAVLSLDGGRVTAAAGLIAELKAAGLAVDGASPEGRRPLPPRPVRALALPERPSRRLVDSLRFWRAWVRARRLGSVPLIDLLAEQPSARPRAMSDADLGQLTATFVRLLPWAPGQGACLYRAYLLRTLLRQAGADAEWVFGVRTWPFSAHCWLQVADAVLDDDPDRVGAYTPILVA